ncbi:MAG TPA: acyl-CoA dehydrogenase family protein [Actinomycetota bacterium]|nr:acyl-CoA dehydrogenase family protein [Actinomycetota bacterium]
MNFTFSEEQEELRRTIRRFLDDKSPSTEVRRLMETPEGYDEAVWKQMAQELGLQALEIPEEYGGQGFSFVELGIVLEEMGRALLCAPFFSTVAVAANAILNAGTEEQKKALLPGIASGETIATLALGEPDRGWTAEDITLEAKDGVLNGVKTYVIDGATANLIVVAAREPGGGISLYTVRGDAEGLSRSTLEALDLTRKLAKLEFSNVEGELLGEKGNAWPALQRTLDHAAVALAAEMCGGAQRCLDMAVQYAKDRVQFGRPIGSFQAIKHKCADMLLEVESAKTATYYALWVAAADDPELPVAAPMAKAYAADAFFKAARDNIQVHGGIGFTWEHDAHLYYRRAKSDELMFGDAPYHRELLAQRLGI